jgi:K+-transporting ATPase ATPase C chain
MRQNLRIAVWMTVVTTALLGGIYPLAVTGLAHWLFPAQANGSLIHVGGKVIGSRLIGQSFSSPAYFHSRPSAAGPQGYDPMDSGGSNLGPTNRRLIESVEKLARKLRAENPGVPIPVDLVTASGSGLDPDISPAAARFQAPRVARARGVSLARILALVREHTRGRTFGFLGEPRVNVLELNLALDRLYGRQAVHAAGGPARPVSARASLSRGARASARRPAARNGSRPMAR